MVSPEPSASTQCPCPSPASLDPEAEPGKKPKKRSRHHQRVLAQRSALSVSAPGTPRPCAPVPWPVPLAPCPRAAFLGRPRPGAAGDPWVAGDRVASPSKCVAIDCEMVGTGPGGRVSELARCSVVSYHGDVLYDKYVLPERPVTDFRSRWSGVTQRHLSKAVPFQEARKEILKLLKGKVVVGHALHNDFQALKYAHPRSHTRDTTCVPSLLSAHGAPARARVSLKDLALQLLRKRIQVGQHGHSSVEDAATAMELYRLVEARWEAHMGGLCAQAQEDREAETGSDMQQFMDDRYWPEDLDPGPGGTRGPCGE